MREVKFRAWDEVDYVMIKAEHLAFEEFEPLVDHLKDNTCMKFMQYTGERDSNGVEMYDQDIVKVWANSDAASGPFEYFGVVRWYTSHTCGWNIDVDGYTYSLNWSCEYGGREVVGNTYENPELLSSK